MLNNCRKNLEGVIFSSKLTLLELLGPLMTLCAAPEMVMGQHLVVYVDNAGSCHVHCKGYCTKCDYTSCIAKACWDVAEGLGATMTVEKIRRCSDHYSKAADCFIKAEIDKFREMMPNRDAKPADVPKTLVQWLHNPTDDNQLGAKLLLELNEKVEVVLC